MTRKLLALFVFMAVSLAFGAQMGRASEEEKPIKVDYRFTPPAPREQSEAEMMAKSEGCYSCHVRTDRPTKIGRASCRERVCQYVEISGAAVSLKKKQATTKREQRNHHN